jgi:glycosyltransferase involved in cell wall biosynthesis
MNRALISCIVPAYNCEQHLEEALASVLAQDWRPLEVIVVDDGSTDCTLSIARAVAEGAQEVRVLSQENGGPSVARNTGISEATGELVCFLDADDIWHPEKLRLQAERFRANPALDHCVHHIQNFWDDDLAGEAEAYRDHARGKPVAGYVTPCLMVRRRAFERIGVFDSSLKHGDSADWFLRAREAGLVGELMPEVLTYRRMHAENRSRVHASRSLDEFFDILKRSVDRKRTLEDTD